MFATALIVFRESLEAALFVGIVAAATRQLSGRTGWLAAGVGLGALGALVLAVAASHIADAADGIGQDLVNIVVLAFALAMLLWHCIWVSTHSREMASEARRLGASAVEGGRRPWPLLVAVGLAVLREGAETVLFVSGALTGASASPWTVAGSVSIGLLMGITAGGLMYVGLSRIPARQLFATTNVLIALLAASIASQLVNALSQAGFIEGGSGPLWDSSSILSQGSAVGTVLHALVGYEAQPSALQLASYFGVLALIYVGTRLLQRPRPT